MKEVGVGIIGLGLWGETIIKTLSAISNAKLAAVCSRSIERAEEISERYSSKKYYDDYNDLVKDPNVQIVVVATEENRHVDPTLAAIKENKHVFLEKPIATTLEDADTIIQAANNSNVKVMVGHIFRFDGRHAQVKELIEEGKLGKVSSIFAKHNVVIKNFDYYKRVPLHMVSTVHEFDLACWYLDDEPSEVYCIANNALGETEPDSYWITVKFKKGAIAAFQTVWLISESAPVWLDVSVQVIGTEGYVDVDNRNQGMQIWTDKGTKYPMYAMLPELRNVPYGSLRNELEYFIDCVINNKPVEVITLKESREALRLSVLAEESLKTGNVIKA